MRKLQPENRKSVLAIDSERSYFMPWLGWTRHELRTDEDTIHFISTGLSGPVDALVPDLAVYESVMAFLEQSFRGYKRGKIRRSNADAEID